MTCTWHMAPGTSHIDHFLYTDVPRSNTSPKSRETAMARRASDVPKPFVSIGAITVAGLVIRCLVATQTYSGHATPPMFGDYEAQRHWMEITTCLPLTDWYRNTTNNDLLYWGLDYPPLTAFHSYLLGKGFQVYEPEAVALHTSRGYETISSKLYMRASVIVSEGLTFLPALWLLVTVVHSGDTRDTARRGQLFAALWLQPALILVDHGHFQYNTVSLGFAVAAFAWFVSVKNLSGRGDDSRLLLGAVALCCSLNFKQMSLYYAPAPFFFLLGEIYRRGRVAGTVLFVKLGVIVVITFGTIWSPFVSADCFLDVLHRMFPFNRGLYEDKVANIWCTIAPIFNFKNTVSVPMMAKVSMAATIAALTPACVLAFRARTWKGFMWSLVASSLAFFLLSFQVHEKTILLPLLPLTLLATTHPIVAVAGNAIACFSMFPLLERDGLGVPYLVAQVVTIAVAVVLMGRNKANTSHKWQLSGLMLSLMICLTLHIAHGFVKPPRRLPDLWPFLMSSVSCAHFVALYIFAIFQAYLDTKRSKQQ